MLEQMISRGSRPHGTLASARDMQLTIHRGSRQIGGSCVEVASGKTRIILDVGTPLEDVAEEDLRPKVDGLFNPGRKIDAIILSHAHLDHSGLLWQTRPEIPVYLTSGTSKMLMVSALYGGGNELPRQRQHTVAPGEPVTIGNLTVRLHSVDHSVFGSTAVSVEDGSKRIMYSGDLRAHGRKPGMARDLVAFAKANPIDALVMEGTHVGSNRGAGLTELELESELTKMFRAATSLILGFFSPQNLDRLVSFYKAARKSGRIFVVDRYTAAIMYLLHSEVRIPKPSLEAGIRVYFNRAGRKIAKIERNFAEVKIELKEILDAPQNYVMTCRPSMVEADFDSRLPSGTIAVYSMWSGYLTKSEWIQTRNAVGSALGKFIECHASGHIHLEDLEVLVSAVGPKVVIPIHTKAPETFAASLPNAQLLGDGVAMII